AKIDWLVFIGLGVLSLVPSLAGVVRVAGLASGTGMAPDNARFYAMPLPVVIHIICATLFCVLGIFQLAPNFRRRRLGWHRRVGWLLAPCGVGAGLSGLWMTQIYPLYPSIQDEVLYGLRIVFGSAMVVSIILSMAAILRRDIAGHRAWMIRGYAIGQGAGTQAVIGIPLFLIAGDQGGWVRNVMMGAGWVINVAVAEWIIRRKRAARQQPAPAPAAGIMSQA
ncbi:MAG TPA: DUF2306 domain-containing protein, partial [Herpetosiphonaceae bacterium]